MNNKQTNIQHFNSTAACSKPLHPFYLQVLSQYTLNAGMDRKTSQTAAALICGAVKFKVILHDFIL